MGAYSRGALNRIWALIREGRLLNFLDYQGALIREGRLKDAGRLFELLRYTSFKILAPLAEEFKILAPWFKELMLNFTIPSREAITIIYVLIFFFYLHNDKMNKMKIAIYKLNQLVKSGHVCDKYPHIKQTDAIAIEAFIGLLYFRGSYNLNFHSLDILFSNRYGLPVFGAVMSRLWFKFLLRHLCWDDQATRQECCVHDRFAALQDVWGMQWNVCKDLISALMKLCTQCVTRLNSSNITQVNHLNIAFFSNH